MASLAREMGFTSETALNYAKSASNHHHAQTLIQTMLEGNWCELLVPYVRARLKEGKKVSVGDFIYHWAVVVKNVNYQFQFNMLWRYVGGFQLYHIGIRRNNPQYVRCGLLAFAPLFSCHPFTSNYQLIELQERCLRTLAPVELRDYLESTESISSTGNPSKGEGLDAQLEEVNKASKVWEHGAMTAREWLTIFRNHDELNELRKQTFSLFGVSDPKSDDVQSRERRSLENEVLAWRVKLRQERYLAEPDKEANHVSIDGKTLDKELINISAVVEQNRKIVLKEVLLNKRKRTELPLKQVYVLASERLEAEQIGKMTKAQIIVKLESITSTVLDSSVRQTFEEKVKRVKARVNSTPKEQLVSLFKEIEQAIIELNTVLYCTDDDDHDQN